MEMKKNNYYFKQYTMNKDINIGDCQLLFGDCLERMKEIPDGSIDCIITDPPYELDNHGGGITELAQRDLVKNLNINFISKGFDIDIVLGEFLRVCKTPNMLIFCSNKQISKTMNYFELKKLSVTLLVWNKTNPSPLCNGKHLSDAEFIVYVRGKGATFNNDVPFAYKKKIYASPIVSNKNRLHPTQKSVNHIKQYIELHTNKNDIVFDPFMGSGSTGVACINNNRKFIGIEIDEKYYDISCKRIKDAINDKKQSLFK